MKQCFMIALLFVLAIEQSVSWADDRYECYSENDLEEAAETAVDDLFAHCLKIDTALGRLACYDKAMEEAGYRLSGSLPSFKGG